MNFFYDEINKLANESVGITGNISLDQSTETNDLIYGKLNKEVETNVYQGKAAKTTTTIVDNEKNTISVEVNKEALSADFVNHNTLNASNTVLNGEEIEVEETSYDYNEIIGNKRVIKTLRKDGYHFGVSFNKDANIKENTYKGTDKKTKRFYYNKEVKKSAIKQ